MKKIISKASDIFIVSVLASVIVLMLVGIYYVVFKKNAAKMQTLYDTGSKLSHESPMEHFVRITAEKYFERALTIPNFDFDTPMYFDRYGNLVPIGHQYKVIDIEETPDGIAPMESTNTSDPIPDIPLSGGVPDYIPPENPGKTLSDAENEKQQEPKITEYTYTDELSEEDAKKLLEYALHNDDVFLGMDSRELRNTGIGIGIEIGRELITRNKKFGKLTKATIKKITNIAKRSGIKTAGKVGSKNAARTLIKQPSRLAAKGSSRLFAKIGPKKFAQMGMLKAKNAASKALKKAGAAAAKKGALKTTAKAAAAVGTKAASIGAKVAIKASAVGPVAVLTTAFDITGLALDMTDTGGYMMLDTFKNAAESINKNYAKMFAEAKMKFPQTIGPLDKLRENASDEYLDMIWDETFKIINDDILNFQNKARDEFIRVESKKFVVQASMMNPLGNQDKESKKREMEEKLKTKFNIEMNKYFNNVEDRVVVIHDGLPSEVQTHIMNQATKIMCKKLKEQVSKDNPNATEEELPSVYQNQCIFTDSFEKEKLKRMNIYTITKYAPYKTYVKIMTRYAVEHPKVHDAVYEAKDNEIYEKYVKTSIIERAVMAEWCKENGGKILPNGKCTYNSEKGCNTHYKILENGEIDGVYAVWDPTYKICRGGQAAWTIKAACNNSGISYNPRTGRCQMTEKQCQQKSGKWDPKKKDCIIPDGQSIIEFIFPLGSTGYRFFKQVLDMDQYLPCPKGTTDHGYVCNKNTKSPDCSVYGSKWYDEGTRCANITEYRTADCPKGYTNNGVTCGKGTDDYSAPSRVADCPKGYTNNGATCGRGTDDYEADSSYVPDCPDGYRNDGHHCMIKPYFADQLKKRNGSSGSYSGFLHCHWGRKEYMKKKKFVEKYGSRHHNKVKHSNHKDSRGIPMVYTVPKGTKLKNTHMSTYRQWRKWRDELTLIENPVFRKNQKLGKKTKYCERSGAFFYGVGPATRSHPGCKKGYSEGAFGRCYPDCKPGYTNMGLTCHRPASTKGMGSMSCPSGYFKTGARCYKNCRTGYTNMGETCHKPVSTLWGTKHMKCLKPGKTVDDPDWYKVGGLCYQKANTCPSGYKMEVNKNSNNYKKCVKGTSVQLPIKKNTTTIRYACAPNYSAWMGKCRANCPKGWTDDGIGCWKKRKIAISTAGDNRYGGGNTFD